MFRSSTLAAFAAVLALLLTVSGCDFLDPTDTENPQTTDEELRNAPEPVSVALPGVRAQFARAVGAAAVTPEFVSDNFSVHGSGISSDLDFPTLLAPNLETLDTAGEDGLYWNLQELRALAEFVLTELVPIDETETQVQIDELNYYVGMALLMQGENFVAVPTEEDGTPVPAADLLQRAVDTLTPVAQSEDGELALQATAALARAHRALGNVTQARQFAEDALAEGGSDFLFVAEYDSNADLVDNPAFDFLVQRSLQEMQPLPRLDFLDPKYGRLESGEDPSIPYAKAEEMHLILAEVALSEGVPGEARGHLQDALDAVTARDDTVRFFDDDERLDNRFELRPRDAEIEIAFAPGEPFQEGLVLSRPGPIATPLVSGTSVTDADLTASADADLPYWLYLMRQEVLLLEGRRMHDLGIRLPIMQREIDASPAISEGALGTSAVIPGYIPESNDIDRFDPDLPYNADDDLVETQITMRVDMNRVLVDQRGLVIDAPFPGLQ